MYYDIISIIISLFRLKNSRRKRNFYNLNLTRISLQKKKTMKNPIYDIKAESTTLHQKTDEELVS